LTFSVSIKPYSECVKKDDLKDINTFDNYTSMSFEANFSIFYDSFSRDLEYTNSISDL